MTALSPAPDLSLADYTDERFTDEQRDKLVTFDAAEEPEEVTVIRAMLDLAAELDEQGHRFAAMRDLYSAGIGDARIAAAARIRAALTALRGDRAPLAGQHTTDEEGR